MATHARGLICLCLTEERCDELGLPPDGRAQRGAAPDRVHRLDRGARRRHHGHLRRRTARARSRSRSTRRRARTTSSSPATSSRSARETAACSPRRPDRGGRRPRPARRPQPRRRRLRDHEGGRDDGARTRPRPVLRAARHQADHRRRPRSSTGAGHEKLVERTTSVRSRPRTASSRRSRSARS